MTPPQKSPADTLSGMDELISNLAQEFLTDAVDTLGSLGQLITETQSGGVDTGYTLQTVRREIHTLKGQGSSFGYPSITVIAHRLENYLVELETLSSRHLDDILKFVDRMQEIADTGVNPDDEDVSNIVRTLPAKGASGDAFE